MSFSIEGSVRRSAERSERQLWEAEEFRQTMQELDARWEGIMKFTNEFSEKFDLVVGRLSSVEREWVHLADSAQSSMLEERKLRFETKRLNRCVFILFGIVLVLSVMLTCALFFRCFFS